MEPEVLSEAQKLVQLNAHILRRHDLELTKDARILDFGCGSGRHVYEYLDAGFEHVSGFDVQDYTRLRTPSDRSRFRFLEPGPVYRIPFPDDHFDFIQSTSVFEHVANPAETIAEIARVLKPDGATLHVFPSRWRPIEPHIFVPFGGAIQNSGWLSLWAALGVRNGFQRGMSAADVAARNRDYCANGIHYLDRDAIDGLWRERFRQVDHVEAAFIESTRAVSTVSRYVHPLVTALPALVGLYRLAHTRVVLARQPR